MGDPPCPRGIAQRGVGWGEAEHLHFQSCLGALEQKSQGEARAVSEWPPFPPGSAGAPSRGGGLGPWELLPPRRDGARTSQATVPGRAGPGSGWGGERVLSCVPFFLAVDFEFHACLSDVQQGPSMQVRNFNLSPCPCPDQADLTPKGGRGAK